MNNPRRSTPKPQIHSQAAAAYEPAAYVPPAPSKAKRPDQRAWMAADRERGFVAISYRHIPAELRDEISRIAQQELHVTTDEVARAFLEYALEAYRNGEMKLNPQLVPGRFTLFGEK